MEAVRKAYLQLHFSVFLWGFTAILGRLISLNEVPLVWYRLLITCISLLFLPRLITSLKSIQKKEVWKLAGIGCLVCLHWVCFYGSIKYSNVSVALSCLATTTFFTSLAEPAVFGRKIKIYELGLGLLIIPGIYLMFHFTSFSGAGIVLGLFAAFFAALFSTFNKVMVEQIEPRSMTFIELGSGFVFLSILLPFYMMVFPETSLSFSSNYMDIIWLLILSLGCTTLPFVMSLRSLKHLSAFASVLTVNLEPLYGILLAIPIFHENQELDNRFYLGTLIMLSVVFIHPFLKKRFERKEVPIH